MVKKQYRPNLSQEQRLWKQGFEFVVGLDEAGRGPLAGPVTAAAVMVRKFSISNFPRPRLGSAEGGQFSKKPKIQNTPSARAQGEGKYEILSRIRDSKKLSENQRERWYEILVKHPNIKWGIGLVSEKIIDKINIFEATKLAMKKALNDLQKNNCRIFYDRRIYDTKVLFKEADNCFLLIDGNFILEDLNINQKSVIRGDEKIFSCAAASIIAKVTRDRLMQKYHKKFPQYGFDQHKGYGTKKHFKAIKKYGPCSIHRRTFATLN
jgi:ribonuclease HII